MPLNLFYTMVQKSQKWPKTQIKGGSYLKHGTKDVQLVSCWLDPQLVRKKSLNCEDNRCSNNDLI